MSFEEQREIERLLAHIKILNETIQTLRVALEGCLKGVTIHEPGGVIHPDGRLECKSHVVTTSGIERARAVYKEVFG